MFRMALAGWRSQPLRESLSNVANRNVESAAKSTPLLSLLQEIERHIKALRIFEIDMLPSICDILQSHDEER